MARGGLKNAGKMRAFHAVLLHCSCISCQISASGVLTQIVYSGGSAGRGMISLPRSSRAVLTGYCDTFS